MLRQRRQRHAGKRKKPASIHLPLSVTSGAIRQPESPRSTIRAMRTSRRTVLQTLAAAPACLRAQTAPRPNILFVLSDDHSAPYLGAYGAAWMSTPNTDQFAREGLRFDRAFTAAPQCVPSRTALMTGRSPVAARMGRFSSPLPPDIPVVPEVLRAQGYYTGVCGRYFHLDGVNRPSPVTAQVYEKYQMRTWKNRVDFLNISSQTPTPRLFDQFLAQKPSGKPWFFWINYNDPHHPWDEDAGKIDPAKIQLPPHLPDLPGIRKDLARYCGEVERADRSFGEPWPSSAATTKSRTRWWSSWAITAWPSRTARAPCTTRVCTCR
jgi:arylsulfatase A-like enzyme